MENFTCGLTQEKLDAHPTWITVEGRCVALKPDGTQCNCPYSAHLSAPAPTPARLPQPTGMMTSAHVNAYVLNFQLTNEQFSVSVNIKLDTGCSADLVITDEIANALHLSDNDFTVRTRALN